MSGYGAARDRWQLQIHELRVDEFIRRYPGRRACCFCCPAGWGASCGGRGRPVPGMPG